MNRNSSSTVGYILESLIPFTEANMKLAFKPHLFFNELDKRAAHKRGGLRAAYYRAIRQGLITLDDQRQPHLTAKGTAKLQLYRPKYFDSPDTRLLVTFDIPEDERAKRQHLRTLLKELKFHQIQKSVWATEYDGRDYLIAEIKALELASYVVVYEAHSLQLV